MSALPLTIRRLALATMPITPGALSDASTALTSLGSNSRGDRPRLGKVIGWSAEPVAQTVAPLPERLELRR